MLPRKPFLRFEDHFHYLARQPNSAGTSTSRVLAKPIGPRDITHVELPSIPSRSDIYAREELDEEEAGSDGGSSVLSSHCPFSETNPKSSLSGSGVQTSHRSSGGHAVRHQTKTFHLRSFSLSSADSTLATRSPTLLSRMPATLSGTQSRMDSRSHIDDDKRLLWAPESASMIG